METKIRREREFREKIESLQRTQISPSLNHQKEVSHIIDTPTIEPPPI